jgi:hypothetical protein
MKWYLAKLIYRIVCENNKQIAQFDEQLRLITANEIDEAFTKAQHIGLNEEECFYNQQEQLIKWQFINVSELYHISDFIDGAEVFSRVEEVENAEAYITFVHQRAVFIQKEYKQAVSNLI